MKRIAIMALAAVLLLCACSAGQPVKATEPPAQAAIGTPDASQATPVSGYVIVRRFEGMQALRLHSQPDPQSPETGRVAPGAKGKIAGLNASGTWALLIFPEQSGWAPVPTLDLVIAQ